jgi:hypothetical protein
VAFRVEGTEAALESFEGDASLKRATLSAQEDLAKVLSTAEARLARSDPGVGAGRETEELPRLAPRRRYELAPARDWIVDVEVDDAGGEGPGSRIHVRANGAEAVFSIEIPALLEHLRGAALNALLRSAERPRRPLDWHGVALAGFLDASPPAFPQDAGRAAPAQAELRTQALAALRRARDPRPLAIALLEHAQRFDEGDLAAYSSHDLAPLRLLPLVRRAQLGDEGALREVFVLSQEYHAETALFARVLRLLFPRASNAEISARYFEGAGDAADLTYLQAMHGRMDQASFASGRGWFLPP